MNKIRNLFVALSLFAAFTANAALDVAYPVKEYKSGNKYLYQYRDAEGRLNNGANALYYLAVVEGKLVVIHSINSYMDFRRALWQVQISEPNGVNPLSFSAVNEDAQLPLMLAPDRGNTVVGTMNNWRLTIGDDKLETSRTTPGNFYTYDTQGDLYALTIDTQPDGNGNYPVGLKKYSSVNDAVSAFTRFLPAEMAQEIILTANDINTYLDRQGEYDVQRKKIVAGTNSYFTLDFDSENTLQSPVTGWLQARALDGAFAGELGVNLIDYELKETETAFRADNTNEWVALSVKDTKTYLLVDTVFYDGGTLIKLGADTLNAKERLKESFLFQFRYDTHAGQLKIRSKAYISSPAEVAKDGARWLASEAASAWWSGARFNKLYYLTASAVGENGSAFTLGSNKDLLGITLNADDPFTPRQLSAGLYLVQRINADEKTSGYYAKTSLGGGFVNYIAAAQQYDFQSAPSAQWVLTVENNKTAALRNREFPEKSLPNISSGTPYAVKGRDDRFYFAGGDTLQITPVADPGDAFAGYYDTGEGTDRYSLRFFHELANNKPVNVSATGNRELYINVQDTPGYFELEKVLEDSYGYAGSLPGISPLKRNVYRIALAGGDGLYVACDEAKRYYLDEDVEKATCFFIKGAYQLPESEGAAVYYTLLRANMADGVVDHSASYLGKVLVNNSSLNLYESAIVEDAGDNAVESHAFMLTKEYTTPYRTLGAAGEKYDAESDGYLLKWFRSETSTPAYLYESSLTPPLNYLGVTGQKDALGTSVIARRVEGKDMPRYLFMVDYRKEGDESRARLLVNLADSVAANASNTSRQELFQWKGYTRLAFVDVLFKEKDSVMYFLSDGESMREKPHRVKFREGEATPSAHTNYTFSLRLIHSGYDPENPSEANDFLIESGGTPGGLANNTWVTVHEGVPVVQNRRFAEAVQAGYWWNAESTTDRPTSTESITPPGYSVIGGKGCLTVKGAKGAVTVYDRLGRTIVRQTISTDEAVIQVPSGILFVKPEGREAVKVLVE